MANDESHDERLVKIELLLMQLQHDMEQLNKALIDQQADVDSVKRTLDRLAATVDDNTAEPRSPEDERPPHY